MWWISAPVPAGARTLGFTLPAGGKTGTTNDYTDAWFVGYTADLVCGSLGRIRPAAGGLSTVGTGSLLAVPIWANFMRDAHETLEEIHEFPEPPDGLTTRLVCKSSGLLATRFCPEDGFTPKFSKWAPSPPITRSATSTSPRSTPADPWRDQAASITNGERSTR